MARDYGIGSQPIQAPPSKAPPSYLPALAGMGALMGTMRDPEIAGPPKSLRRQDMGSVVGKRGAGSTQITGGNQMFHSMGHYGKQSPIQGI